MVMNKEEMTNSSNEAPAFNHQTISEFLAEVSIISNTSDKSLRFDHFITRLEDEMRKIDALNKQELPLSVLLVNDAIVALKEEHIRCRNTNAEPVFHEFLVSKESYDDGKRDGGTRMDQDEGGDKKSWMSSVKLWNNTSDHTGQSADHNCTSKPISIGGIKKRSEQEPDAKMEDRHQSYQGRAEARTSFPFTENSTFPLAATGKEENVENKEKFPVAELSLVTSGTGILRLKMGSSDSSSKSSSSIAVSSSSPYVQSNIWTSSQTSKKQRRHWSPELHRRFVSALQQLGGSQATAKQIRELMQVDGLTITEINSHLQKYRLHNRRSSTSQSLESPLNLSSALSIAKDGKDSTKTCSKFTSPEGPL